MLVILAVLVAASPLAAALHEETIRVALGHPRVRSAADLVGGDVDDRPPTVVIAEVRGRSQKSTRRNVDELPEVRPVQRIAGRGVGLEPDRDVGALASQ